MKKITNLLGSLIILSTFLFSVGVLSLTNSNTVNAEYNLNTGVGAGQGEGVPAELTGGDGIFKTVANVLLYIIGGISVIMLIYGGIRYTTSGGNSTSVTAAKNTIMYSVLGLIIAILAFALVNFVTDRFIDL